jgi:hypothetical protein
MKDLSYTPAQPRIKEEEVGFLHWDFFYIEPGKEKEVMALAKEYLELYKSKGISDGYNLWIGDIGHRNAGVSCRAMGQKRHGFLYPD